METSSTRASFSIPSISALIAALASFAVGPAGGFILALVAIAFGLIGVMLSFSAHIRGGFLSIFSIIIGGVAILVAVIRAVGHLL